MTEKGGQIPTKEQWFGHANETFHASGQGLSDAKALLIECRDIVNDDVQETFALVFQMPPDVPAVQGIYQLQNETIGALDLFLVPIRADEQGLYLEALFNRLKEKEKQEGVL